MAFFSMCVLLYAHFDYGRVEKISLLFLALVELLYFLYISRFEFCFYS